MLEEGEPGSGHRLMLLLLVFDVLILVFFEPVVEVAVTDTVEPPPVVFF